MVEIKKIQLMKRKLNTSVVEKEVGMYKNVCVCVCPLILITSGNGLIR